MRPCSKDCTDCKYFDYDEYWDGVEEYGVMVCEKGHYDHVNWNAEPCEDFEEDA